MQSHVNTVLMALIKRASIFISQSQLINLLIKTCFPFTIQVHLLPIRHSSTFVGATPTTLQYELEAV
jgi:hypothetical protein